MAYVSKYTTTEAYESATVEKPFVGLTEDDNAVHFDDESWIKVWTVDGTAVTCSLGTYASGEKIYIPSSTTSLASLFTNNDAPYTNIKGIDVSRLDLSGITSLYLMFAYNWNTPLSVPCLDVSNWNTSSITNMSCLFQGNNIEFLDVSNWDTSKVTDMSGMFYANMKLNHLDVSKWDTSSVVTFNGIFGVCLKLEELDVSNWDVSNATNLGSMFRRCETLKSLDVSKWDTSKCAYMAEIFENCYELEGTLDLSNWDTSKVTSMEYMFRSNKKLTNIKGLDTFSTSKVYSMYCMFQGCNNVAEGDLKNAENFDTSSLSGYGIGAMFLGCDTITSLDLSGWDVTHLTNLYEPFSEMAELVTLDLSGWKFSPTGFWYGFANSPKLTTIKIGTWDLSSCSGGFNNTFGGCGSLTTIEGTITGIGQACTSNVTYSLGNAPLTEESVMVFINGLYDLTANGSSLTHTLSMSSTAYSNLTEDDIAIATNKGWIVSH